MTLKEKRIKSLLKEGFLQVEAEYYSSDPISIPGMKKVRRLRNRQLEDAKNIGMTKKEFLTSVREQYIDLKYVDKSKHIQPEKMHGRTFDIISLPKRERELDYQNIMHRSAAYKHLRDSYVSPDFAHQMVYHTYTDEHGIEHYYNVDLVLYATGVKPIPRDLSTDNLENISQWRKFIADQYKTNSAAIDKIIREQNITTDSARRRFFYDLEQLHKRTNDNPWKRIDLVSPGKKKRTKFKNPSFMD